MRLVVLIFLAFLASVARAETLAVTGARAWTMTGPRPLENATILVRDGRVVSVVAGGPAPAGARVIAAGGRVVTPALFHPATQIGLSEVGGIAGQSQTVGRGPLGPAFDVAYGLDANAQTVRQARADGVARALVYPGGSSSPPFDGTAALLRLGEGGELLERRGAAVFATIGGDSAESVGGSRAAAWRLLRAALDELAAPASAGRSATERDTLLSPVNAAALRPVLARSAPLTIQANRESDLRQALALAHDYHLRLVLLGAAEAWRIAPLIAAARVPVILDPLDNLPSSYDQLGARRDNAAILARAGVLIAFSVSGQEVYRSWNAGPSLREGAGMAVANGLPYATALAAITANPARIWGLEARAGALAPGYDADLVIWDGDPLEPSTAPALVMIAGREASLVTRQTRLRDRYAPAR